MMVTIKRFEDLEIWQLAREAGNKVFEETQKGKLSIDYKLRDPMNNSGDSIMDNIAERFGRSGRLEFIQFLSISKGSGNKLQSQPYRCPDRKYFQQEKFEDLYELVDKLCRKIFWFMDYLNKSSVKGQKFANRIGSIQHQTPNPKPEI